MTKVYLNGITATFTTTLTILTEQMVALANQVSIANNNGNQRRDKRGEQIKPLWGGNNLVVIVENQSSKEEEPDDEEIVDHGN